MKRVVSVLAVVAVTAVMLVASAAGAALAVRGPNEAGLSRHFHPKSNPCQGPNHQPNCPGPH